MARAIDADIIIKDLTAMKKMYDAIELDGMIKALKEAPTIEPKQEWISVEDGLPKAEERVLVLAWYGWDTDKKYPHVVCGMYEDGTVWREDSIWNWETDGLCEYDEEQDDWKIPEGWFEYCLYNEDNLNYGIDRVVTHWMPLPEPPKEGDLDE